MVDWNGNAPDYKWFDFIRSTLHHPGILEDNRAYAAAIAAHYDRFPNVIAYQIYNEPHFPGGPVFDYHPATIEAYCKWLTDRGELTAEEATNYQPPRGRKEQSPHMWALWRLFSRDSITAFLNNAHDGSKAGSKLPTYTCYTGASIGKGNVYIGCDLFANARAMDIAGYTTYYHACGQEYYLLNRQVDTVQCAAELGGTQSWCIELDSRTYIPPFIYTRGAYAVLGSGCKGIVPMVQSLHEDVAVQLLQGDGYTLAVLTNIAITERTTDANLQVNIPFTSAVFRDIDGEKPVTITGNHVTIHNLTNGGILVLR